MALKRPRRKGSRAKALLIVEQAEAFFMACRILRRPARKAPESMAGIPVVVNAALALELYLKALLTMEGTKFRWIHDLEKLFLKLSHKTQRLLIRRHKKWESHETLARLIADGTSTNLLNLLRIGRCSFDKFRYRYENPTDGTVWGLDPCLLLVRDMTLRKLNIEPHPSFVELYRKASNG